MTIKFTIFALLAATTFAQAQTKNCNMYSLKGKAPIVLCNSAINAYNRINTAAFASEERVACEQSCDRFGAIGANGILYITSHQQFKVRTLKRYIRDFITLGANEGLAVNGVLIENLNTRIAEGALQGIETISLDKPLRQADGKTIDTVYVLWTMPTAERTATIKDFVLHK
jgi:hypothetical protein